MYIYIYVLVLFFPNALCVSSQLTFFVLCFLRTSTNVHIFLYVCLLDNFELPVIFAFEGLYLFLNMYALALQADMPEDRHIGSDGVASGDSLAAPSRTVEKHRELMPGAC